MSISSDHWSSREKHKARKFFGILTGIFLLGLIAYLVTLPDLKPHFNPTFSWLRAKLATKIASPLVPSKNQEGIVAADSTSFWQPQPLAKNPEVAPPIASAKAAMVSEIKSQTMIYEKNPTQRLPVASLQKIVTGMVVLDHLKEGDIATVSPHASSKEPDSMGLFPGEKLTIKKLLYGIMLVSGNDAATLLAERVSGNEKDFASLMDQKAGSLGLMDSHFVNPTGLDGEGFQYSSAHDLTVLSVYLLGNYPLLAQMAATREISLPATVNDLENHKDYYLPNLSPTLDVPGYQGIKPGYTPEAGRCLITLVERDNRQYLIVVLGSEDRKGDTEALLDYALKNTSSLPAID